MASDHPDARSIADLVAGFRQNLGDLRDPQTSEAAVRQEYIDPFWKALGWDVANDEHRSHAEKDVLVEAPLSTVEGERVRNRRPDYLFRIDGFPRFVVEAKKPAVDLKNDRESIFQAKTYAWNAQIPFAILTSFQEFRLYDTTIKPYLDEPDRGLIEEFDLRYEDYVAQWDVLVETFGREAVAGGSLERLLARLKKVRAGRRVRGFDRMLFDVHGTEPVDRVFLKHLEDYRLRLARDIYQRNPARFREADTRRGAAELAEATQRLIDRLVFMRVCEDRGIISYGTLRGAVETASRDRLDLHDLLRQQLREFDARFNGYLFKAHFSEELSISAELLADFVRSLYLPEGPYRFDAIGDDLLGIIYERFLGSGITVERRVVETREKPEVRHAGGVYYTPRFVVDAIIRRVVAPKVEGRTPWEVRDVKILDPACGSGSFLIAAYQYLVDYCCRYVAEHPKAAESPASSRTRGKTRKIAMRNGDGRWLLTPDFKAELLTSCIHGVDIDAQAVEVTIMSLYLKTLENMPEGWQRGLMEHRLLPPLDNNIRCGNSLLSRDEFDDYWDQKHGTLFPRDPDVVFRMNAFDWSSHTRGFGRVFAARNGFDCIVGNPPYIRVQELNRWAPEECEFYKWRYKSAAKGNYDIYVVFIERALELLADDGLLGFICPHKFWQAAYGEGLRRLLAEGRHLRSVIDFTDQQVFHGATTYTAIHVFSKNPNRDGVAVGRIFDLTDGDGQCRALDGRKKAQGAVKFQAAHPSSAAPFVFVNAGQAGLLKKLRDAGPALSEIAMLSQGFKTGADKVFVVEEVRSERDIAIVRSDKTQGNHRIERALLRLLIKSEHMRRYWIESSPLRLIFPYVVDSENWRILRPEELSRLYPLGAEYLAKLRRALERREAGRYRGPMFYRYSRQQNFLPLSKPKIIVPDIADRARFAYDENGSYVFSGGGAGGNAIIPTQGVPPRLLLGILNSRVTEAQLRISGTVFRGGWLNCEIRFLRGLRIKLPNTPTERKLADRIIERVEWILAAKKELRNIAGSDRAIERLQREIEAHEQRIDELVCRLYGVDEIPEDGT